MQRSSSQADGGSPALADEPEIYRRSFTDSTDAIVITDVRGRIVTANPAWLELFGYTLDEVRGKTTKLIQSEHTTPDVYRHMWSQILDPAIGSWRGEIVNRKRSGEEVPMLLTITPIRRDREIVGYMGIGLDITERRELELLRERYEMVVRHDLKAPLASVMTMLGTMAEGLLGELTGRQQAMLQRVLQRCAQMQEIIATSLDVEKLKQRTLSLDFEDVDLLALIRSSAETIAPLAERRQVAIALRVDGREPAPGERLPWRTDPVHLQRCLVNLIKNAVEASPPDSEVLVSVRRPGGELQLEVHSDGPPIPPPVRATLFHPYSTYGKRGGTGLGLYGVKLTVEALGGTIAYASDERGTTFTLELGTVLRS